MHDVRYGYGAWDEMEPAAGRIERLCLVGALKFLEA
jgi:hypothetical protein